jgi:hypothetical protein
MPPQNKKVPEMQILHPIFLFRVTTEKWTRSAIAVNPFYLLLITRPLSDFRIFSRGILSRRSQAKTEGLPYRTMTGPPSSVSRTLQTARA